MSDLAQFFNSKSEYDAFVKKTTGEIDLSKLQNILAMSLWGLIGVKARAIFHLSDMFDSQKVKKKYS